MLDFYTIVVNLIFATISAFIGALLALWAARVTKSARQ
jgi:hypothetical protein